MGRTNLIILGFGIFACIALSLMMNHAVKLKDKKDVPPAVYDLHSIFGEQLIRRPTLKFEQRRGKRVAVLSIVAKDAATAPRLARTVGKHLLHFRGPDLQFDAMEVVTRTAGKPGSETISVRVPGGSSFMYRRFVSPRKVRRTKKTPGRTGSAAKAPASGPAGLQRARPAK